MKKLLRLTCLMAATVWGSFAAQEAKASHAQGSDLTYVNVGPSIYVVQYKLYRDCTGITLGTTETLTYRAPGCNATSRTLSLALGTKVIGTPYCGSIVPDCSDATTARPNYEEHVFSGTLTLPTLCPNWILSARIGNRNSSRNLSNGGGEWLFSEAMINNVATQFNTSPTFGNIPIPFVCVNQEITFNQNVTDLNGDSMVYTLAPALTDLNAPVAYATYPAGTSPAPALIPYPAGTFSATNPIISQNPVQLDRFTGSMTFKPLSFIGTASPTSQGRDKYVMAVQVDEYRKINGVVTKIGHVRRDILVVVVSCADNVLPALDSITTPSGTVVGPTTVIEVEACNTAKVEIKTQDMNPQDVLKITSNALQAIPGSQFTTTGGARPVGTFTWTPTMADVRPTPYQFQVTIRDNACPIPGFQTQTVQIKVIKNNFATATVSEDTICAGNQTTLMAVTTRPDTINTATGPIKAVYRYDWAPADGLALADTAKQNPVVSPTQTTRYFLTVHSPDPFLCPDTASVLVTVQGVVPQIDTVTARDPYLCYGDTTTLLPVVGNDVGAYSYAWSPGIGLSDSTIANPIARPGAGVHRYFLRVYNAEGCEDTASVVITVGDSINPSFDNDPFESSAPVFVTFRNTSNDQDKVDRFEWTFLKDGSTGTPQQFSDKQNPDPQEFDEAGDYIITLTVYEDLEGNGLQDDCPKSFSKKITVPEFFVPNIITPNGDGINDVFVIRGVREGSTVKIFNRWGSLVKEIKAYSKDNVWDAKGASDGIYYYLIKDDKGKETKGWLEIVDSKR